MDFGTHFNNLSRENLFASLSHVSRRKSLLVTSRETSKLLNYLTPFSVLREKGGLEKTLFLDDVSSAEEILPIASVFESLTVIISGDNAGVQQLKKLWSLTDKRKPMNVDLIVQNLSKSVYRQILSEVLNVDANGLLAKCSRVDLSTSVIRASPHCKILPWKVYPIIVHDNVLSLNMDKGGLSAYLNDPIQVVSKLGDSLVDILCESNSRRNMIKMKNIFAKGDHSSLLVKNFLEERLPTFISTQLSFNEQEFYSKSLSGNADLVVLERNLDYFPLFLSQMNYMGLLDDTFGTEDELNNILSTKDKLDDELYRNIAHLNFGFVGAKLNKLAKYIQLEFENSDKLNDLAEIKQLVKNLGNLTSKQDMVSKHTQLSEAILQSLKSDTHNDNKFNIRELWLEFQNEIFDLDYKSQLKRFYFMLDNCAPFDIVMNSLVLISLTNDGLRQNDIEVITRSIQLNFSLKATLRLKKLLQYKIVKVNTKGNDFFGTFTFGKTEIETTTASTFNTTTGSHSKPVDVLGYEDMTLVGISGGQDVYKSTYTLISKFWNLHPLEDDETDSTCIETVFDYKQPSFALPSGTVPLTFRIVEALYLRDFLKYKPVNNTSKRPNWNNLNLDTMFKGQTVDINLCDTSENRKMISKRPKGQQYVILVLLGGVTRSEISVFQYLQSKIDRKILIVTTGIVNNKTLWKAMS